MASSVVYKGVTKRHRRQALYPQGAHDFVREIGHSNEVERIQCSMIQVPNECLNSSTWELKDQNDHQGLKRLEKASYKQKPKFEGKRDLDQRKKEKRVFQTEVVPLTKFTEAGRFGEQ